MSRCATAMRQPLSVRQASRCDSTCVAAGMRVHSSSLDTPIMAHYHPRLLLCITPLAPSRASLHPASIALVALCTPSTEPPVRPVLTHTLERAAHCRVSKPDGRCIEPPSTLMDPRAADQRPCALLIPVALDASTRQRSRSRIRGYKRRARRIA